MNAVVQESDLLSGFFEQASTRFDEEHGIMWLYMEPRPRACFTPELLSDIKKFQRIVAGRVRHQVEETGESAVRYVVLASGNAGAYNLGGDLNLFKQLIRQRQKDQLFSYARECVEAAHQFCINLDVPVTSISLVQGNALGGGFEAALSCNVIIAEKGTQLGFPEVLFNLFPGMGAYSFLTRRITPAQAERMILSGKLYSAEELYEMGVVDVLADPGDGEQALYDYVKKVNRAHNAFSAVQQVRRRYNTPTLDELLDITRLWVDSAMRLQDKDLRTMERLVRAQNKKTEQAAPRSSQPELRPIPTSV